MAETNIDPKWAWAPYKPTKDSPWDIKRVGHLYRRAAFGATIEELERALDDGPDKTLTRLFTGDAKLAAFERETAALAESIAKVNNGQQIRAWWVYRMLYSPYPLVEKMTLFWHNHFATSNAKVQSARFMLDQYELMRRHALGNFATLVQAMSKDPAMMVWLDTRDSKKGNPNENYARELMELFSLGIGNYTEKDIREAARAFTGWEVRGNDPVFNPDQHDKGPKTVLGQTGKWTGEDIVRICLEQPACPRFIVTKLFRFLVSETLEPTSALIDPLADQFKASGYEFGQLVRTVLSSNLFFSKHAYRTRIKPPVEYVLGIVKGLEGRVGTSALAQSLEELGQNLFNPPSVKGWDGGPTWLNGQTLLYRQNLALALTSTEDIRFGARTDPAALAAKHGKRSDEEVVAFFLRLFLQEDVPAESQDRLVGYLKRAGTQKYPVYWTEEDAEKHRVRAVCHLALSLPEFQLS